MGSCGRWHHADDGSDGGSVLCLSAPSQEACGPQSPSSVWGGEWLRALELGVGVTEIRWGRWPWSSSSVLSPLQEASPESQDCCIVGWCVFVTPPPLEPSPRRPGVVRTAQHHLLAQSTASAGESRGGIRTQPGSVQGLVRMGWAQRLLKGLGEAGIVARNWEHLAHGAGVPQTHPSGVCCLVWGPSSAHAASSSTDPRSFAPAQGALTYVL